MQVMCENTDCKKVFNKPACWAQRSKRHFCSIECHNKVQTIYPAKLCHMCGMPFKACRGNQKKYSTCPNPICRAKKKRGINNGNWRGGVTSIRKRDMSTAKYRCWRKAVFERDNYMCQNCGQRGGNLEADHIKPWAYFPSLRYKVSNGRTLCLACHRRTFKTTYQWRHRYQVSLPGI